MLTARVGTALDVAALFLAAALVVVATLLVPVEAHSRRTRSTTAAELPSSEPAAA